MLTSNRRHNSPFPAKASVILVGSLGLLYFSFLNAPETILDSGKVSLKVSWISSLAALLQQGQISGRDFTYTYGLLPQVITWIGTLAQGSGSPLAAYPYIIISLEATSIILLAGTLALIGSVSWREAILVYAGVWILQLIDFAAFRPFLMVLAAVVLHRALFSTTKFQRAAWTVLSALVCVVAQLASVDLGLLAVTSVVLVGAGYVLLGTLAPRHQPNSPAVRSVLWVVFGTVLLFALVNLLLDATFELTSPNYNHFLDYQRYALETIRGYDLTMASPWGLQPLPTIGLFAVLFVTGAMTVRGILVSRGEKEYLLLGLMIFAALQLKSVTVRSDDIHIIRGALPFIFLFLISANEWVTGIKLSAVAWGVLFIVLVAVRANTSTYTTQTLLTGVVKGQITPAGKLRAIDSVASAAKSGDILPAGLWSELQNSTGPLLNFPFENYIAIATHRELIAPIVLAHNAHTEALQWMYVRGLDRLRPSGAIVYATDGVGTHLIDGVQQITRLPIIFEGIYENYELQRDQPHDDGFYVLRPRQRIRRLATENVAFRQNAWDGRRLVVQLDRPTSCGLIRVTFTIDYPIATLIGRPAPLQLNFQRGDESVLRTNAVALETKRPFSTYVSSLPVGQFQRLFGDWEGVQGKEWDNLVVTPVQTGFLGVIPTTVKISKVECVILTR